MKASKLEIDTILLARTMVHWWNLVHGIGIPDSNSCPLCGVYQKDGNEFEFELPTCEGCPIKIKTGRALCEDTPWRDATREWRMNITKRKTPMYHNIPIEYRFIRNLYYDYVNKMVGEAD